MLTKFSPTLFLDQKVEIDIGVWETVLCHKIYVVEGLMVQFFTSSVINLSGFSRRGGGTHELEPVLFLFFGTVFFGATEEERLR